MIRDQFNLVEPESAAAAAAGALWLVRKADYPAFAAGLSPLQQNYLKAVGFAPEKAARMILPDGPLAFLVIDDDGDNAAAPPDGETAESIWWLGDANKFLPSDTVWAVANGLGQSQAEGVALGFVLGSYQFEQFTPRKKPLPRLVWPNSARRDRVTALAQAIYLARDVINCPANHFGPSEMVDLAASLARRHQARCQAIIGDELLAQNYPLIHTVGRASAKPPALIDLRWGDEGAAIPRITLVGKGVTFDSGGLDIKPSSGMILMKKDLGGAATMLALGHVIMALGLRVRLRILIPTVENMISGAAMRPSDVVVARSGQSVEIGNTDAEGRLILADALSEADSEKPDLLIDGATLTGAARVALGPEIPAYFTRHDHLAARIDAASRAAADPMWRLPLWPGYRSQIDSKIADLHSTGEGSLNGAISAALFLAEFVRKSTNWVHIDMMAWNPSPAAGRPQGGEAQTLRALFAVIEEMAERAVG